MSSLGVLLVTAKAGIYIYQHFVYIELDQNTHMRTGHVLAPPTPHTHTHLKQTKLLNLHKKANDVKVSSQQP